MHKDKDDYEKQIKEMREADFEIKSIARYYVTKGNTVKTDHDKVTALSRELKIRLKEGSWSSLSHMRFDIMKRFSVLI